MMKLTFISAAGLLLGVLVLFGLELSGYAPETQVGKVALLTICMAIVVVVERLIVALRAFRVKHDGGQPRLPAK